MRAVAVRQFGRVSRRAPGGAVLLDGLCQARFLAVVRTAGRDRVEHLHHLPLQVLVEHGALVEQAVLPEEAAHAPGRVEAFQVRATVRRRRAGGDQRGPALDRAVAIGAVHLDGVARLAVELAVAVAVLGEVAVDAVHAFFQMDVLQLHGLLQLLLVGERDDVAVLVEQIAVAVLLEDGAEDPAVAVEVGELRVLQLAVELRRAGLLQERRSSHRPRAAAPSGFCASALLLKRRGRVLSGGIHRCRRPFRCPTR